MRFGSLFSGIGGFDLGFERAGMECVWQVEIDKDCQRVLARHFPNTERFADVSTVGQLSAADVICGGFPCQDLSVAGKRAGLAGERSGLWFEFLRIIESNLPRWIVIENVPGLLSSDEGRDFAAILRGLVECGYCLAWRILDAQYDGVAQRRRRVFIVGSLGDGSSAEILFESESVSWNPPTRREAGPGVTPILEAGARTNGDGNRDGDGIGVEGDPMFTPQRGKQHAVASYKKRGGFGWSEDADMTATQESEGGTHQGGPERVPLITHALSSEGADASEDGTGRGTPLVTAYRTAGNCGPFEQGEKTGALNTATDPSQNIICFSSKDHGADAGKISPTLRSQNFKDSHMNGGGQVAVAFQEAQTGVREYENAGSLRANAPGTQPTGTLLRQGFGVRRLTPRECERLQGFPDDWTAVDASGKEISDSARYRMLGNAVCVNVAEWIGKRTVEKGTN